MIINNLTDQELVDYASKNNLYPDRYWGDYYRKYIKCPNDKDNVLGLYHKLFQFVLDKTIDNLQEEIEEKKYAYNNINQTIWEYHVFTRLFALVNRVNEAQNILCNDKNFGCNINSPIISGIALYNNYPVGTYFSNEIFKYRSLNELINKDFTPEEIEIIFDKVHMWVETLMQCGVYSNLYFGNIMVNPDDYSDVILDGLDGPSICRVENDNYIKYLKRKRKYRLDIKQDTLNNYEEVKNSFVKRKK